MRRKVSETSLVDLLFCFSMMLVIVVTLSREGDALHDNVLIKVLFAAIGIYSICEIMCDKSGISLNKMHWYFVFFFMSVAPLTHYLTGYYPGRYYLSEDFVVKGELIVLLWCAVYSATQKVALRRGASPLCVGKSNATIRTPSILAPVLLTLSLCALFYIAYRIGGFSSLLLRGEAWIDAEGSIDTVLGYLFRAVPVLSLALLYRGKRYSGATYSWLYVVALVPLVILLNYPVSLSRYWTAVVYIGLFAAIAPPRWLSGRKFDLAIILGIGVVFPLMYDLKFVDVDSFVSTGVANFFSTYDKAFNSVDFDAFAMLCRIIQYADVYGLSFGRQLVSVVFFFIPRAVLPIKGSPTGSMVASAQGSSYTNLSAPIMGEGYIDFGIVGVAVYAVVFASVLKYIDRALRNPEALINPSNTYSYLVAVFMLGFVIFLMRGALQPVFLRVMGFFLFLIMVYAVQRFTCGNPRAASSSTREGERLAKPRT